MRAFMREHRVASFQEFHDVIKRHNGAWWGWFYRGHSRPDYDLCPKVGRPAFAKISREKMLFERWKRHAVAYVSAPPQALSEWDWLAIAQHHGLATRLLDWTFNPLAAAYFALVSSNNEVDSSCDSIVYAHFSHSGPIDTTKRTDPFQCKGISRVAPGSVAPRIGRQGGIFTVHGPPNLDLKRNLPKGDKLEAIIISRKCKKRLRYSVVALRG